MPSELREIQGATETVRGTAEHRADVVSPAGNVVETIAGGVLSLSQAGYVCLPRESASAGGAERGA